MTRAELRRLLTDFRAMVRARGPGEVLEVAAIDASLLSDLSPEPCFVLAKRMQCLAARAALRWWRWKRRGGARLIRCVPVGRLPPLPYDHDD